MSYWDISDGSSAIDTGTEYEVAGGNFIIPDGSAVLAMPDEAKWEKDFTNNEYVQIRWVVLKPEQFANQKVFQKLWIEDDDPKAKDPVKMVLAGLLLLTEGRHGGNGKPVRHYSRANGG